MNTFIVKCIPYKDYRRWKDNIANVNRKHKHVKTAILWFHRQFACLQFEAFMFAVSYTYWDIPLNENLPKPVIDLPIPNQNNENPVSTEDGSFSLTEPPKGKPKGRRKK
ncbi:hypothetical protein G7B40_027160 [Aetokthonos hydrillicola Thurmond2011]|uniref:Uncharacterized protein n=2 Tax=Aetokthonos TaxID=1550243 RepID=A0AAP5IDV7_9CYAN|nr:hypothetical protein [Aetokthonos hydrillicola]MDR9898212.1 hypothetical protein [Aetokthonos hydrillicola Thurmond2011]